MALDRPQTVGATTNAVSFELASEIKAAGATFKVKCDRLQINTQCPLVDATGEFDTHTVVKHTGRVTGKAVFFGYAIKNSIIGLSNLPDEEVVVHAILAHATSTSYRLVRFNMAVSAVSVDWARQAPVIPVRIEGQITGNVSSESVKELLSAPVLS